MLKQDCVISQKRFKSSRNLFLSLIHNWIDWKKVGSIDGEIQLNQVILPINKNTLNKIKDEVNIA